jgi:NHL repeat
MGDSCEERIDLAVGYSVDPSWPHPSSSGLWGETPGVAVAENGIVWTASRADPPIRAHSLDGELLAAWGAGMFRSVHYLRPDAGDTLWIVDTDGHAVYQCSADGEVLTILGTPDVPGSEGPFFNRPTDVARTPNGHIFVADGYGNNRIVHFDADARYIDAWGSRGAGPGELNLPHSVVADSAGLLYVAERNNARIQVFDASGNSVAEWRNLLIPWGLWMTAGDELLVCGSSPMRWTDSPDLGVPPKDQLVLRLGTDGKALELWLFPRAEGAPSQSGTLAWVHGITVDHRGDLYLSEIRGERAQKFVRLSDRSERAQ